MNTFSSLRFLLFCIQTTIAVGVPTSAMFWSNRIKHNLKITIFRFIFKIKSEKEVFCWN